MCILRQLPRRAYALRVVHGDTSVAMCCLKILHMTRDFGGRWRGGGGTAGCNLLPLPKLADSQARTWWFVLKAASAKLHLKCWNTYYVLTAPLQNFTELVHQEHGNWTDHKSLLIVWSHRHSGCRHTVWQALPLTLPSTAARFSLLPTATRDETKPRCKSEHGASGTTLPPHGRPEHKDDQKVRLENYQHVEGKASCGATGK